MRLSKRNFIKTGLIFVPCAAAKAAVVMSGPIMRTTAAAGGCTETYSNDGANVNNFGAGNRFYGQAGWQRPAAVTICRLEFKLQANGSGTDWFVAIYTQTASDLNLAGQQAVSAAITGANWAAETWVGADLITPFAPAAATNYSLVIFPNPGLGSNDVFGHHDNTALPGYREVWDSLGAANFGSGNDTAIKIFTS